MKTPLERTCKSKTPFSIFFFAFFFFSFLLGWADGKDEANVEICLFYS